VYVGDPDPDSEVEEVGDEETLDESDSVTLGVVVPD
jgi:hypothetical protein